MRRNEDTTRPATRATPTLALLAGAVLALVAMPLAFAGAKGPEATTSASTKKQIKSLQKRVAALEAQKAPTSLPPSGAAGGDLTGVYPNPTIGPDKVTTAKIANDAITAPKILDGSVGQAEIGSDAVGSDELKPTAVLVSGGVDPGAGFANQTAGPCPAGQQVFGGGYSWDEDSAQRVVFSTPDPLSPPTQWIVRGGATTATNTLFAWVVCMTP